MSTVHAPTSEAVVAAIRTHRYAWKCETDLQEALADVLTGAGFDAVREVVLAPRERIDLLVGTVGIEVKVALPGRAAPSANVARQLRRYAAHDRIDELVLVTTSRHHRGFPAELDGKPLTVVHVGGLL